MEIKEFNRLWGKIIKQYDSKGVVMRKILRSEKPSHVGIVEIEAGGVLGYHAASINQVLIIIEGGGWVRTNREDIRKVKAGDVVLWEKGEGHETGTDSGLTAIFVESDGIDLESLRK